MVPDESVLEGSIKTMSSLFRSLSKKQKSAVVWGKLKSNSNPAVYILSPSTSKDLNEGFYLTRVPFVDEVRKFPPIPRYDEELGGKNFEQMCKITETLISYFSLRRPYKPSDFKNPTLQKHFKLLYDYLLQVEVDCSSESVDGALKHDDTLLKLYQVRRKIQESLSSKDPEEERLGTYVKAWNSLYNKISNQELTPDKGMKKQKK